MALLVDRIEDPSVRAAIVRDCEALLSTEVASRRGLSGLATKGAFKLVHAVKPGFVRAVIEGLLEDFLHALQPHCDAALAENTGFGKHLVAHGPEVAEALLAITDQRAERTPHKSIQKAYRKLRPTAVDQILLSMPALGDLADRHFSG